MKTKTFHLVASPRAEWDEPVRTLPAALARHEALSRLVPLTSPLRTDSHAGTGISFFILLAKDKMGLLKSKCKRKCHNFRVV